MKTRITQALSCISLAFTFGCATVKVPTELADARGAYAAAATDAGRAAPSELHVARVDLDRAEAAFAKEPKSVEVKDLSYIAQRHAELATARAAVFISHEQRDAANLKLQSLGVAVATELRETQEDLTTSLTHAHAAERDVKSLRTDLKASETQANGLKSDLKVSESRADDLKTDLNASATHLGEEMDARHDAEQKLAASLQANHDLQSVKEESRGLVITLSGAVLFASNQSVLLPAARSALNNVADVLKSTPNRAISIEGYTDSQGSVSSNMDLSQRRGEAVRSYLVSRGIPERNIRATGFGADRPVADNATSEGRANNRRVEIVLAPAQTH